MFSLTSVEALKAGKDHLTSSKLQSLTGALF